MMVAAAKPEAASLFLRRIISIVNFLKRGHGFQGKVGVKDALTKDQSSRRRQLNRSKMNLRRKRKKLQWVILACVDQQDCGLFSN